MSGSIVFTTIHTQDFQDEASDRAMGRQTLVIQIGQMPARLLVLVFVLAWSWYFPVAWGVAPIFRAYCGVLGMYLGWRIAAKRSVLDDEHSFRLYNVSWL